MSRQPTHAAGTYSGYPAPDTTSVARHHSFYPPPSTVGMYLPVLMPMPGPATTTESLIASELQIWINYSQQLLDHTEELRIYGATLRNKYIELDAQLMRERALRQAAELKAATLAAEVAQLSSFIANLTAELQAKTAQLAAQTENVRTLQALIDQGCDTDRAVEMFASQFQPPERPSSTGRLSVFSERLLSGDDKQEEPFQRPHAGSGSTFNPRGR